MKKLLLSFTVLLFFFGSVNAQLVADAGPDATMVDCIGASLVLGGSPTASGGSGNYSYQWAPAAGLNNPTIPNPITVAGISHTVSVTVTDNISGDTAVDDVFISVVPSTLFASSFTSDTVSCIGTPITFTSTGTGGTPPYTFTWDFSDGSSSNAVNPVHTYASPGNYWVYFVIEDAMGCLSSPINLALTILQSCGGFNISKQDATCFGSCNGSATVTPAGNYTYLWNNNATTATITNLCAGNYSVTVMDSVLNPLDTLSININQPAQLAAAVGFAGDVLCFGGNNGNAQIVATGGTSPYSYLWNNGMISPVVQNLSAGAYSVTVVDNNSCSATVMVIINEPPPISTAVSVTDETSPGACDGSIVLTANGGVSPYTYLWSNNSTAPVINNLCPGNYTVTIIDANGCANANNGVVAAACPNNTLVVSITSTGDLDCTHAADTLTANVSGGTPPYTYFWPGPTLYFSASIIVNQAGIYDVWVTDSAGCSKVAHDTVQNLGVFVSLQSATAVACNGVNNGRIVVTVSGGAPPYTYLWSNGATADSIVGIPSGTYTLTVTDATSCTSLFSYFLNQTSTNWSYYVYVTATHSNCGNNGTATANVYGGTAPFTYLWNTVPAQTTQTATGLSAGYHTVTVTGTDGCFRTGSASVQTSCYNVIRGRLINDLNANCTLDSGETAFANQTVIADGASDSYGYTDAQGYYTIYTLSGSFTIRPYLSSTCVVNCSELNSSYSHTFSSLGDTLSNTDFYLVRAPFDLFVSNSWTGFRPGFTQAINIYYGNTGADTVDGTLVFTYDADLVYQSSTGNGVHNATNHTITWTLTDIVPMGNTNYYNTFVTATFLTPVGTPLNTPITNITRIAGLEGECDTTDNVYTQTILVRNSYDPNDKAVLPSGDIFEEDSILTYTIRFQNTGNDTAWFVILKDTLSSYLEPGSVENLASSHPISEFKIEGEGILTWVFNPIYLVDSITNEEASHGYVIFRVKKRSGLPLNTPISNEAHIYFDYNEPVVTNTVTNTLTEPNYIFNVRGDENISVTAMPNPFTQATQIVVEGVNSAFDFELFDVTGKMLKKIASINDNRFELKREDMSAGVYFYRITTTTKQKAYGRVIAE